MCKEMTCRGNIIMIKIKKIVGIIMVTTLALSSLTACGSKETSQNNDVTKVVVGTGNSYEPYCYLNEDGNLAGYEYEVLQAVDELLPQYEFEYQTSQFADVLVALDAGQIDLAAHQYEKNTEREKKYLYGTESYTTYVTYPVVLSDNDSIEKLDDLQGKIVFSGSAASNSTYMLNQYNESHSDNPIIIKNLENATREEIASGMKNKLWDAAIMTKRDMDIYNSEYGNGTDFLKIVDDSLQTSSTYWLYAKDNTELQQAVDGALKQLRESGKLAEISIAVIGGDYTEGE